MFTFYKRIVFLLLCHLAIVISSTRLMADPPNCPCLDPDVINYEECMAMYPECNSDIIPVNQHILWLIAAGVLASSYYVYKRSGDNQKEN
jgi:hypothetical protein